MYVYWWHVGELRAVKVGYADDPVQRVNDYRDEYGFIGEDVRGYELVSGTDAEWVERHLCRLLETRGLRRIALWLGNGEEEFFTLDGCTFEDAHAILHDAARHIALAEVSNRRKQQRRHELEVAEAWTPDPQEQETEQAHEELRPQPHRPSAPARFPVTARLWLYLIGAIVVSGMVTGLRGDELTPGPRSAILTEQENPSATAGSRDGAASAGSQHSNPCTLVEFSDTLIHVSCTGSWVSMRWNGRWVIDSGHNESDALDFFNASDVARRVVAVPSHEPVPQLPEKVEIKPERSPQSHQPAAPAQPRPRQAAPRPATAQPQQPPPQETPLPRQHCTVSRPKPGFQVYLVTCPDSHVMIGRTVDSATGWTVSESVNGTEAIEFFMKSPYAR